MPLIWSYNNLQRKKQSIFNKKGLGCFIHVCKIKDGYGLNQVYLLVGQYISKPT